MAKLIFSICSESVSIDALTNNVSIFHIIENIKSVKFPVTFYRLIITSEWQREVGEEDMEFESRAQLINTEGRPVKEWKAIIKFDKLRHRHFVMIRNVEFDKPGEYCFLIFLKKKEMTDWGDPVHRIPILLSSVPELPNIMG